MTNKIKSITHGNFYDSRVYKGRISHQYALWTTGSDVKVILKSGEVFFFRFRNYTRLYIEKLEPIEIIGGETTSWEENTSLEGKEKELLLKKLFPGHTDSEYDSEIYGV